MVRSFESPKYVDLFDLWTNQAASGNATTSLNQWDYVGSGNTGGTAQGILIEDGGATAYGGTQNGTANLTSTLDMRSYRLISFSASCSAGGESTSSSRSSSGTATVRLTDGTNTQNLCTCSFSESYDGAKTGAGAGVGGYFLLEIVGNTVNIWRQAVGADGADGSGSSSFSIVTSETALDISTWSGLYIELVAAKGGSNGDGNAKAVVANILASKKIVGSKGRLSKPE